MPLEFARMLKYTDPKRYDDLRADAYVHYWKKTTPEDEDTKKMLEYVNYIEDETNRLYKQVCERL